MKKTILFFITVIFALSWSYSSPYAEFNSATFFSEKSRNTNYGIALKTENIDLRFFALSDENRWSARIKLFQDTLPLSFSAGNLLTSGYFSKLRSISPSTACSPFSAEAAISSAKGTSLPSLTSSGSAEIYCVAASSGSSDIKVSAEGIYMKDSYTAGNIFFDYNLNKLSSVKVSFTGGRFFLKNNTTALKKTDAAFNGNWYTAGLLEAALKTPRYRLSIQQSITESPYNQINDNCSLINGSLQVNQSVFFKNLLINTSFFILPFSSKQPVSAPMITASSSVCRTVQQFDINPQIIFLTGKSLKDTLKFGFHWTDIWKVTSAKTPVILETQKYRAAAGYDSQNISSALDFTAANILISELPPDSASIPEKYFSVKSSNTIRNKLLRFDGDLTYKYIPARTEKSQPKKEITFSSAINFNAVKTITGSFSATSAIQKNRKNSQTVNAGISWKNNSRWIRTYIRINAEYKFQ